MYLLNNYLLSTYDIWYDTTPSWITALSWWRGLITQWRYEPCSACPPKMDGSQWRVLTKHGPLEKGMANHFSILAARTPWTAWKSKKIWHPQGRWAPPGWKMSNILLGKSRGQLLTAPERMKQLGQSRNDAQVWMCLVVKAKSDAIKNNIA